MYKGGEAASHLFYLLIRILADLNMFACLGYPPPIPKGEGGTYQTFRLIIYTNFQT
jgi:hypothetical protein